MKALCFSLILLTAHPFSGLPAPGRSTPTARNRHSSVELRWQFGGKLQQGWYLYIPLICREVRTEERIDSDEFAQALARWQGANGLRQSGVMDGETWATMVNQFQSRRIKERSYPSPENQIIAPASDFYDIERPAELRRVDRSAYAAYRRMVAEAVKDKTLGLKGTGAGKLEAAESYLKIISAFRSREYQDKLRKSAPRSGRAGLALNSPHFTGRALDLYVGGEPVSTLDSNRLIQTNTAVYKWLVNNAARFGFHPYFYEPWHWEYVL